MSRKLRKSAAVGVAVILGVAVLAVSVGVASDTSVSKRATKSAQAVRVDQHAFPRTFSFWKCSPENDVARRDMIAGPPNCNVNLMRRLNPKGVFLLFPSLFPSGDNPWSAGDLGGMNVTYGSALWYWRQGYAWKDGGCDKLPGPVNLGCIRPFNFDWDYMWNANGVEARVGDYTGAHRGFNVADPMGKGTRELVAKFFAYTAKLSGLYTKGWDGVFSDNWSYSAIGLNWAYGPNLDTDRDGKVDDIETLRKRWNDGLNEVGNRIRSYLPGKIVAGNNTWFPMWLGYQGTDPQGWLKASNATFVEDITGFYDRPELLLRTASRWLTFKDPKGLPRYVVFQQDALTGPGRFDRLSIPSSADPNDPKYMLHPGVMRSMRWGLTLALMSGAYYEIIVEQMHGTRWWYDEYDGGKGIRHRGYLGNALGPAVKLEAGGVWRRDFEHGIALNNSTSETVTIDLKKPFRRLRGTQNPRLNDGRVVTRVTLVAHDGLILLKIKQK